MSFTSVMFLGISLLVLGTHANVVDFIDPCHVEDKACILQSAKKIIPKIKNGIPDLGIPAFDPMEMKNVDSSSGSLELFFKTIIVHGIGDCTLLEIVRTSVHDLSLSAECPIKATGQYKMNGKLKETFEIFGEGDFSIIAEKILIKASTTMNIIQKDNIDYYKLDKYNYEYKPILDVNFKFDNLFDGDKSKADVIEKVFEEKEVGKDLLTSVGKGIVEEIVKNCFKSIGKFLLAYPIQKIELS